MLQVLVDFERKVSFLFIFSLSYESSNKEGVKLGRTSFSGGDQEFWTNLDYREDGVENSVFFSDVVY
jgi:hypothetical protein